MKRHVHGNSVAETQRAIRPYLPANPDVTTVLRAILSEIIESTDLRDYRVALEAAQVERADYTRAVSSNGAVFSDQNARKLLAVIPDERRREWFAILLDRAHAFRRSGLFTSGYEPKTGHSVLISSPRRKTARYLSAFGQTAPFVENIFGICRDLCVEPLDLVWPNVRALISQLIDGPRTQFGEAVAFRNAALLFRAMRNLPIATIEDQLNKLTLIYVLGDIARQFHDGTSIELIYREAGEVQSVALADEVRIFANRLANEFLSFLRRRDRDFGLAFAEAALSGFRDIAETHYIREDFPILYETWGSTFFNCAQRGLATAPRDEDVQSLFERHDEICATLCKWSPVKPTLLCEPGAGGCAISPYHADILTQRLLKDGMKNRQKRIATSEAALNLINRTFCDHQSFILGESVMAHLNFNYCEALLLQFTRGSDHEPAGDYQDRKASALAVFKRLGIKGMARRIRNMELSYGYNAYEKAPTPRGCNISNGDRKCLL